MAEQGVVKWFKPKEGYGFIRRDGDGADVFVHHSSIAPGGYRSLNEGDRVSFEIEEGGNALRATNVQRLD